MCWLISFARANSYNARACFHFVAYLVLYLYEMDVILLVDQYLMDKALDLRIRGREFESRYGQEFFILQFSVSLLATRVSSRK